MSDSDNEAENVVPAGNEKALKEAGIALRTGQSAYDNGNFTLAEPLLLKALDAFELNGVLDRQDYFQCLGYLADNYYHLHRYFEAKGYYERLSVARLKNDHSTDAQVVVALLKLASCQEKLHEIPDAINSFDLILELAETTIPSGHALFGVIFDSFETLVLRHVDNPDERENRLQNLNIKREEFGFAVSKSGVWNALPNQLSDSEIMARYSELPGGHAVLTQTSEELRQTLKAWTDHDFSNLDEESLIGPDKHLQVRLNTDMFKRKPRMGDQSEVGMTAAVVPAAPVPPPVVLEPIRHGPDSQERMARSVKRANTDRRPFNPLPAIGVMAMIGIVIGSVYVAHEWTKTSAASRVVNKPLKSGLNLAGKEFLAADGQKKLRFVTSTDCEYVIAGDTIPGAYHVSGEPESSSLTGLFNSGARKLTLTESPAGMSVSDGTMLYDENSKERRILAKIQGAANFGTFYYASHDHLYPTSVKNNTAGSTRFDWVNPLSEHVNIPVVESKEYEAGQFEDVFLKTLKELREMKPLFAVDDSASPLPGQIECMAIVPAAGVEGKVGEAPSAFFIRGYDSEGKMFKSSNPNKTYVLALKNGVSVDPVKASREEVAADVAVSKYSFEIMPMKKEAEASSEKAK